MVDQLTPLALYSAANRAALDALRFGRSEEGRSLARLRARDARALRRLASAALAQARQRPAFPS